MTTTVIIREPQIGATVNELITAINITDSTNIAPPVDASNLIKKTQIGVSNGVASPDANAKIPFKYSRYPTQPTF